MGELSWCNEFILNKEFNLLNIEEIKGMFSLEK